MPAKKKDGYLARVYRSNFVARENAMRDDKSEGLFSAD